MTDRELTKLRNNEQAALTRANLLQSVATGALQAKDEADAAATEADQNAEIAWDEAEAATLAREEAEIALSKTSDAPAIPHIVRVAFKELG